MVYTIKEEESIVRITVDGELELQTIGEFREQVLKSAEAAQKDVEVDLSHVDYIDSTGLALLMSLGKMQAKRGRTLRIVNPSARILSVLKLTPLSGMM
jgi:anti-anti-sigma factor